MGNIQRLIIENFQSHECTVLDFVHGLNVISGPSDHGKSAIIRAIKWILYNEPRGTEFIRHGTSTARVTLEIDNGYKIVRERSQSKNRYMVTDPNGDEMVFEGFGNEIPSEVVNAHGIPKIDLDSDISSSLNIGEQLQGPFLLSETGSVRAKAIGRLIGLHIIDKAIRDGIADLRRENQTAEKTKVTLHEVDVKLEEYKDLGNIEKKLGDVEKIIKKTQEHITQKDKLEKLFLSMEETQREDKSIKETLKRLDGLKESELYLKECQLALTKLNQLEKTKNGLSEIEEGLTHAFKVLNATQKLEEIRGILFVIQEKKARYDKLKSLNNMALSNNEEIANARKQMDITKETGKVESLIGEVREKADLALKLTGTLEQLQELNADTTKILKVLTKTVKIGECDPILEQVQKRIQIVNQIEIAKGQLDTLNDNIKEGNKFLIQNRDEIGKLIHTYKEALKKIGKCPVCDSAISEDKIKDIIKHYEEVH